MAPEREMNENKNVYLVENIDICYFNMCQDNLLYIVWNFHLKIQQFFILRG